MANTKKNVADQEIVNNDVAPEAAVESTPKRPGRPKAAKVDKAEKTAKSEKAEDKKKLDEKKNKKHNDKKSHAEVEKTENVEASVDSAAPAEPVVQKENLTLEANTTAEVSTETAAIPADNATAEIPSAENTAANAENNFEMDLDNLYVAEVYANQGPTMKRWRAGSQGRASIILKRSSHVGVTLKEKE